MSTFKILVVEDDVWFGKLIEHHLSLNEDYEVDLVHSVKELNNKLNGSYNVITLDYSLPDGRGDVLLKQIKSNFPLTDVVIVSGQEELDVAVDLLRHGAYDYIVKNDDAKQKLWNTITKIKENQSLRQEVQDLREQVSTHYDFSKTIIGTSPGIKKVFKMLGRAVTNKINVSIKGETGTGKEVIAKAIHYNSAQKKHPFVGINVSAIPRELIESELFGHEKGAFTGASARRLGKFEMAKNGTLFLDEIGEMDTFMQAKLLRVLQERELTRIGGSETVKVECRIICATHKNLLEEVKKGNFRQDLYYRLIGLPIEIPALRDRKEDIIHLAKHFIELFAKDNDFAVKNLSEDAVQKLMKYPFPGNVRELKVVIDLAMVLSDGGEITGDHIQFHQQDALGNLHVEELTLRQYNQQILEHYLRKYDDNVMKVANILNIGKSTIYRMLKDPSLS